MEDYDLERPKLKEGAIPRIFKNQPAYLSSEPPVVRKDPEDRRQAVYQRDEETYQE